MAGPRGSLHVCLPSIAADPRASCRGAGLVDAFQLLKHAALKLPHGLAEGDNESPIEGPLKVVRACASNPKPPRRSEQASRDTSKTLSARDADVLKMPFRCSRVPCLPWLPTAVSGRPGWG